SVLLGTGTGFGWHFFVDRGGGRAVASTVTTSAKQEVPNPPSSNPPAQREGPVPDAPRLRVYPTPNNLPEAWRSISPVRRGSLSYHFCPAASPTIATRRRRAFAHCSPFS